MILFLRFQDVKEFVEAECLVPITEGNHIELRPLKDNEGRRTTAGMDMASMDSTDTFASCNTHPFNSEADLTREDELLRGGDKDPTLYVNPLVVEDPQQQQQQHPPPHQAKPNAQHPLGQQQQQPPAAQLPPRTPTPRSSPRHRPKPLAYTTDSFDDTRSTDNLLGSSRTSLQESPLPKHRRARFQEVGSGQSKPEEKVSKC